MNLPKLSIPALFVVLAALAMTAAFPLSAAPEGDGAKGAMKSYEGTLKTGVMAIGAETTGVTLTTASEGVYELDLKNPKLKSTAEELNGKKVIVEGIYKPRPGVEVKERRIIDVKSLKAAN